MQINALEYLEETASRTPDKTAFADIERELTFDALLAASKAIGSALIPIVTKGDAVVVISEKSVNTVALYMGVLHAGCFYAPVDRDLPVDRIKTILGLVDAGVILTDEENLEFVRELGARGRIVTTEEALAHAVDADALTKRRAVCIDTDPAYIIFTSGSTGVPKGVLGTHRSLIDYIEAITDVVGIGEDDILGNQSPLDYIAGIRDIYLPLKTGARTELIPKTYFIQVAKLFDHLIERNITAIFWVAPALSFCVEFDAFSHAVPESLKKIVFTGSVMPCRHLRVWQERLPGRFFMNQYGPTEITASCTYYIVSNLVDPDDKLPIGVPFRNTEILLLDEDDRAAEPGGFGEICVRGVCLSPGYYKNPEKTHESFVRNPLNEDFDELIYRTGDIGRWNDDGQLEFYGRRDNQIKHMGHRVELSEIEAAAVAMDQIDQCVSLYLEEKQLIHLFYTGASDSKEIAIFLRGRLPGFMVPRKFVRLDEMPLLANGKVDRNVLKRMMKGEEL